METNRSAFDLHLRQADLDERGAARIAAAIGNLSRTNGLALGSFGVSYNPALEEAGAIALINSLPKTVSKIGMVGCGLVDESGKALLAWAQNAAALRMLCVEGNRFSTSRRQQTM
ncbi:MAG: hypothetical protein WBV78_19030 [Roseobacter sp.]